MAQQVFATKGNLMSARRSLKQAQLGYELMDRKRNILIREMVALSDKASALQGSLEATFREAYEALRTANVISGVIGERVARLPEDNGITISYRSVMGVELPTVSGGDAAPVLTYSLSDTNTLFDRAYVAFYKAKEMSVALAEIENSVYRLSIAIRKTQKRANALKNILIPRYREQVRYITNALEEKEREEFSRQKVIKAKKG
ncbi:MAG: V-type ATP synthase subunit D [Bacteroides sp.]|nr:V-type ATP synthase subunit D [Eubacterium sp.]MCM1419159.1 V-type ATP synthase subunit D [Roseburia sp.]MCM1463056.1 V-type ATP synthase subunit D [Bacteroides sp.]